MTLLIIANIVYNETTEKGKGQKMWEIMALGERIRNGGYELRLFVSYHETELECFEWLVKLKDKEIIILRIFTLKG